MFRLSSGCWLAHIPTLHHRIVSPAESLGLLQAPGSCWTKPCKNQISMYKSLPLGSFIRIFTHLTEWKVYRILCKLPTAYIVRSVASVVAGHGSEPSLRASPLRENFTSWVSAKFKRICPMLNFRWTVPYYTKSVGVMICSLNRPSCFSPHFTKPCLFFRQNL